MTSDCKPAVPGEVQHHCEIYEEPNKNTQKSMRVI